MLYQLMQLFKGTKPDVTLTDLHKSPIMLGEVVVTKNIFQQSYQNVSTEDYRTLTDRVCWSS